MSALRVVRGIVGSAASDARGALPLWLASIPDTFTPAQGRDAAQAALDDADAVIGNVKLRFEGTLPPPPWPKGPQLTKAIGDVEIARDAMAALADKAESGAIDLKWPKASGTVGPTLVRVGTTLYTLLDTLETAAKTSDSVEDFLAKLPKPKLPSVFAGLETVLLVGLVLWVLSTGRKVQRLIEGPA